MSAFPHGSFAEYVRRILAQQPFAFSRWGDGEWSAILGRAGANCDGQLYSARLRRDLEAVLVDRPSYDLGMQGLALRRFGADIHAWLARRSIHIDWVDADVFAKRSIQDTLDPLFSALATRRVILVGPPALAGLATRVPLATHVRIPAANCYQGLAQILTELEGVLRTLGGDDLLLALSAGLAANVIVHRLVAHPRAHTLIDFGSLWEPYVGLAIRRYHRRVLAREHAKKRTGP